MVTSFLLHLGLIALFYWGFSTSIILEIDAIMFSHIAALLIGVVSVGYRLYFKTIVNQKKAISLIKNAPAHSETITPVIVYTKFMIVSVSLGEFPQLAGLLFMIIHITTRSVLSLTDLTVYIGLVLMSLAMKRCDRPNYNEFRELKRIYSPPQKKAPLNAYDSNLASILNLPAPKAPKTKKLTK